MPRCRARAPCHAGRQEFVSYLPEATQGVIVQPVGGSGVLVVGTDTKRGLSRLDQVRLRSVMDASRRASSAGCCCCCVVRMRARALGAPARLRRRCRPAHAG